MKMLIYDLNKKSQSRAVYLIGIILIISAIFVVAEISISPYIPNPESQKYKFSIDRGLKISGEDWFARYSVHFYINGQVYNWEDIPSSIDKNFWKEDISTPSEIRIKYGVDFSNISTNIKNNLNYVVLHLEEVENLTIGDIRKEGNSIIIKDKVYISHDDILRTYSIPLINKTDVIVGGLNNNWTECIEWNETMECINEAIVFNWKDNGDGTFNISFDPTITISEAQVISSSILVNITAETGNSNFTHLNISHSVPYVIKGEGGGADIPSLIGYWSFDGDKENTLLTKHYDWSEYNNDGTGVNQTVVNETNCIYDDCLNVDGDGDYVSVYSSSSLNITSAITISAWVYMENAMNYPSVVTKSVGGSNWGYIFEFKTDTRKINLYLENVNEDWTTEADTAVPLNTWAHIVATWNGSQIDYYYNGEPDGTKTGKTGDILANNGQLYIGARIDGYPFNGSIDEVMIFNTALTPQQILDIYNNQSARFVDQGTQTIQNIDIACYQEFANVSTSCGGENTGAYWSETNYFYVNYTSTGFTGAVWKIKHGDYWNNYSVEIPADCFNDPLQLRFYSSTAAFYPATSYGQCKNSTDWKNITQIKEEEVGSGGWGTGGIQGAIDGNWITGSNFDEDYHSWGDASGDVSAIYEEGIYWLNGDNRINITTYIENNLGSSINLTLGEYNTSGWFYTEPQVVSSGDALIFNISSATTSINLNYTFLAGNSINPFYSPIIFGDIVIDYWNEVSSSCTPPVSGNWPWNFADNCVLSNKIYDIDGYNITSYGSGTWTLENVNLTVENFDLNSTEAWQIDFMNVEVVGS